MFSSLSSFLPSALNHLNQPQSPENAPDIDVEDEEDEDQGHNGQLTESPTKAEHGRKKEKKEKGPHEMFIFVRPPPAKSNHPLNLQVQLVPPNSRQRRLSTESGVDTDRESVVAGAQLSRTPSVASEASSYSTSGYASTSSFQSYSSTASGTSGRRMIIPLYNLQAHNVMTNTIVDAGTDAKIAKFHKRGLEMIDLAVMEPVEVWLSPPGTHIPAAGAPGAAGPGGSGSGGGGAGGGTSSVRGSLDDPRLRQRLSGVFLRTGQSPGSSAVSLASGNDNHPHSHQHHEAIPASSAVVPPAASLAAGKKNNNIFGKLFDRKKKDTPVPATPAPTSAPNINLISPKTPTFNSPKTPTQVQTPASPRHAKNLSASFTGAFRKTQTQIQTPPVSPVPSPSQSHFQTTTQDTPNANNSGRPSTASGVSPTRNEEREREQERERSRSRSRSRGRDDVQVEDAVEITPTISPPPDGSSRFSTLSTTSSVGVGVGIGGQHLSVPSQQPQPQIQIPVIPIPPTLGIHPTLSTPGGPNVLASGAFNSFASKGYPPPKNLGYGKGPAMYVWVVRKWIKGPSGEKGGLLGGLGIRGIEGLPRNDSSEDVFDLAQIEVRVEWKMGRWEKRHEEADENGLW
ncbi:hypothetical protein MPER_12485 [Moniliophthora perniciosa FA553]|nr:hypothetical protein MPER_12485 [Moniliophthora perniciosa FA553]